MNPTSCESAQGPQGSAPYCKVQKMLHRLVAFLKLPLPIPDVGEPHGAGPHIGDNISVGKVIGFRAMNVGAVLI